MGAYDTTLGGNDDGFLHVRNSSNTLEYFTYLGGSGFDSAYGVAVDENGYAYIGGATESADFPTKTPLQSSYGGNSERHTTVHRSVRQRQQRFAVEYLF